MRLERERDDGQRDFWEATAAKKQLEIRSGIVNVKHKNETKTFSSTAEAKAALEKLVATKRKAGFSEPVAIGSQFLPTPFPTNPALAATIRDDGYGVYADWLQEQSPLGEWIALAAALENRKDAKQTKRLAELAKTLALPTSEFATWGTKHGFFEWLRLENRKDWMENDFEPTAFASKLFATPLCAALEELRIGILRWDYNYQDVPAVLAIAGAQPWAKSLARLHLGDVDGNIDMNHHTIGEVGKAISKAFPNLVSLRLHSGSQEWRGGAETFSFAGLALPKLESLVIETCAMTKRRMDHLCAAKLPALRRLEVWFGAPDRGADASAKQVEKLLAQHPKLVHLGLRNHEIFGELAGVLRDAKCARTIESLDLSMATLDDEDCATLAGIELPALRTLDVDDNFVTPAGRRALKAAFLGAEILSKHAKDIYDEETARYCSVSE